MKAFNNFTKGFKITGRTSQMIAMLFLINLIFSLAAAVPIYKSLSDSFGKSEVGEKMTKGFDYVWWQEFRDESTGIATTFSPSILGKGALLNNLENLIGLRYFVLPRSLLGILILYVILHTFLAGGILSLFNQHPIKFSLKSFFEGAGRYFFRFFLITLISWIFFSGIISIQRSFSSIRRNIADNALTEVTPFLFSLFASALIFFLMMFIQMVFDYIRIHIVTKESKNILRSTGEGILFVFRHIGSTLGLYYLLFFVSVAVSVFYVIIKGFVPQASFFGILVAFIFQQIFIFAVIWVRCWLYSSQMSLYKHLKESKK